MTGRETRRSMSPDHSSMLQSSAGRPALTVARWVGHMDVDSALRGAFYNGFVDGQKLHYGGHRPLPGGEETELQYLRGYAAGVDDWRDDNPQVPDPLAGIVPRSPSFTQNAGFFPSPGVRAILPFVLRPATRYALHARARVGAFTATPIPDIPTPKGVNLDTLTRGWPLRLRIRVTGMGEGGCWFVPECHPSSRTTATVLAEVLCALFLYLWPDDPPLSLIYPKHAGDFLPHGGIFVHGPEERIRDLVAGGTWATSWMCLFVFRNRPNTSALVCTFESDSLDRSKHQEAYGAIRAALEASATVAGLCTDRGRIPGDVIRRFWLQHTFLPGPRPIGRDRHFWHVFLPGPSNDPREMTMWSMIISSLRPEDGEDSLMYNVEIICDVCGCCLHTSALCPTRAYLLWTGAILSAP